MNYEISSTGTIRLSYNNKTTAITSIVDGISCISVGIICSIIYIYIVIVTIKLWKEQKLFHTSNYKNSQDNETTRVHIKLTLISAISFTTLLLNSICQTLTFYAQNNQNKYLIMKLNDISYPILDILYCLGPYIILITTKDLRTEIKYIIKNYTKFASIVKINKASIITKVSKITNVTK
ncbi:7TM GPCR, serpentine receptor class v (Srv) family-containing protein [Strongyloides ratti]|uniref:7TM GPCR, serpentine receptor class v (Srv) family-containing protein n=1 Tax=Strongyloides ratti TaxID=34506 RepID=A0A090KUM6_STRRB|nr:7TM GPCR, serpentine receptor class v (Srv) family-containing protein [Strongyloides ratti]CEF61121.1 7TM GPCR, serpentine receptor class v (Srv) family-containing protein [Strongyloides ratti]